MIEATRGSSEHEAANQASGWIWLLVLIFMGVISVPLSLLFANQPGKNLSQWLPVGLHSILQSDYSADTHGVRIPVARINLIQEAILDQSSGSSNNGRFEGVVQNLKTPVPTVLEGFPTPTPTPTATQVEPTVLPTRTPKPTQAYTPTSSRTSTLAAPTRTIAPAAEPTRTSKPPKGPGPTDPPRPTPKSTEPNPTQPPPTKEPTKPPSKDPYPPPPPPNPTGPPDPYP